MKLALLPYVSAPDVGRAASFRGPRAIDGQGRTYFKWRGRWYADERHYLTRDGRLVKHR